MSEPIRSQGGHLDFLIAQKNINWVEDVEILLLIKFCWIVFRGVIGQVENVSANQRPERHSCFPNRPEKHNFCRGPWDHASCQVSLNRLVVSEEKSKMFQPIRGQGSHLVFWIGPKNTNLVENVKILFSFKFCWILFCGFRGEVENVSSYQRPRQPFCFSDGKKKTCFLPSFIEFRSGVL